MISKNGEYEIIRFDLQVLNEMGAPVEQYQISKYDLKKALDRIMRSMEKGEVYAINLRKTQKVNA